MRKVLGGLAVVLALCAGSALASDAVGTTGAQFLELPVNARAIGLGSAYSAIANDASALYYNPAALSAVEGNDVVLMHAMYFQSLNYNYGAAATKRGDWTFGAQAQHLSVGSIGEVDNTGSETGDSFSPRDLAIGLGLSRAFGDFSVGAGGKYVSSKLYETATTLAFDAGSRYRLGDFVFSLAFANMGQGLKFLSKRDSLPFTSRLGAGYLGKQFSLAAELVAPKGADLHLAAGGEYVVDCSERVKLPLRAGYNSRTSASKLGGLTGLNAGAGVQWDNFSLDYAWSPFGDLGTVHYFSLHLAWGKS